MKKAILYCRVSSDEQAVGYSLDYQEERLNDYCKRNDIQPVITFREDASGKTIEKRPELRRALEFAKKNKSDIQHFIVLKWDRFSRSAHDSMVLLRIFEKLGIAVQAVEQPIDFSIPEQMIMLGVYTTFPESENRRRSLNILSGIRKARKSGRYCSNAPWGYSYKTDTTGRKLLTPDHNAPAVRDIFQLYSSGSTSLEQLRKYCYEKYGRKWSKNYLSKNMLINPLYAGMVLIPKTADEPEKIIDAQHEPIIDKPLFHIVQMMLKNKKRSLYFSEKLDQFPLRGFLICPGCGRTLTGSRSRGKTKSYDYYHCRDGCKTRYYTNTAHNAVMKLLGQYKLSPARAEILKELIKEKIKKENAGIKKRISEISSALAGIEQKLLEIDIKFIDKVIGPDSYTRLKQKYDQDRAVLLKESGTIRFYDQSYAEQVELFFNLLINIDQIYLSGSAEVKRRILSSMFPGKIIFDGENCRTPKINTALLTLSNKNINLQVTKQKIRAETDADWIGVDIEALTSNLFLEGMNEIYKLKPLLNVS